MIATLQVVACTDAPTVDHRYGTWENMEVDKCASAWLLKRHVDDRAEFVFFPVGELVTGAIAFDTPDAELRRTGTRSTFENILAINGINDTCLDRIAAIIHQLEVSSWESMRDRHDSVTLAVDSTVRFVITQSHSPNECFQECMSMFDSLYAAICVQESRNSAREVNVP